MPNEPDEPDTKFTTDVNTGTFLDAVQAQCRLMEREASRADQHGYAVITTGQNPDARSNQHLFGYLVGGFDQFFTAWCRARKKRHILIQVRPGDPVKFTFRVPHRAAMKPLQAALDLVAHPIKRKLEHHYRPGITYCKFSNFTEFYGKSKEQLLVILNIFNMPHHRTLLTGTDK